MLIVVIEPVLLVITEKVAPVPNIAGTKRLALEAKTFAELTVSVGKNELLYPRPPNGYCTTLPLCT
jgi:hypothetical protein